MKRLTDFVSVKLTLLLILILVPISRADLIYTPASDTLLFVVLLLAANFAANFAIIKGMAYVFRNFRKKIKMNEIARIGAITLIGFAGDFFMFMVSNKMEIIGAGIFAIAGIASYFLLFKKILKRKQAIISSIVFGIISNPVWILLIFYSYATIY